MQEHNNISDELHRLKVENGRFEHRGLFLGYGSHKSNLRATPK